MYSRVKFKGNVCGNANENETSKSTEIIKKYLVYIASFFSTINI